MLTPNKIVFDQYQRISQITLGDFCSFSNLISSQVPLYPSKQKVLRNIHWECIYLNWILLSWKQLWKCLVCTLGWWGCEVGYICGCRNMYTYIHLSVVENICPPFVWLCVTAHNIVYMKLFKRNGGNTKTTSCVALVVNE